LRLVKDAVIYADGADKSGRPLGSGRVSEADLKFMSRILWGAGAEGLLAVSEAEAEALFAIADATHGADNAAGFTDLFARAVGNFLIGATARTPTHRDMVHRWQTEMVRPRPLVDLIVDMGQTKLDPASVVDTLRNARTLSEDLEHTFDQQNQARAAAIAAAEVMTPDKAAWLLERVNRNGLITAAETALVQFIAREAGAMESSLKDIVEKVA
jgi:hypothetical protein